MIRAGRLLIWILGLLMAYVVIGMALNGQWLYAAILAMVAIVSFVVRLELNRYVMCAGAAAIAIWGIVRPDVLPFGYTIPLLFAVVGVMGFMVSKS